MTAYELAVRDLYKAQKSLVMARKRPNVPPAELAHIETLCQLRKEILETIRKHSEVNDFDSKKES